VDDQSANLQIGLLADHPEHLTTIAGWIYEQWLRGRPGMSLAVAEAKFRGHLQRDAIPTTLIALAEEIPIATASIYVDDLAERRDLGPWLAAVYVAPPWRRRGVGAQIVRATEGVALRLAIPQLFLFTPDQEHFYAQLGWATIGHAHDHGERVVVMRKMIM
jgi:N-acetylglutamate synthase-like GNAT family acetyltransferase